MGGDHPLQVTVAFDVVNCCSITSNVCGSRRSCCTIVRSESILSVHELPRGVRVLPFVEWFCCVVNPPSRWRRAWGGAILHRRIRFVVAVVAVVVVPCAVRRCCSSGACHWYRSYRIVSYRHGSRRCSNRLHETNDGNDDDDDSDIVEDDFRPSLRGLRLEIPIFVTE